MTMACRDCGRKSLSNYVTVGEAPNDRVTITRTGLWDSVPSFVKENVVWLLAAGGGAWYLLRKRRGHR
jgi:hypothetical protein